MRAAYVFPGQGAQYVGMAMRMAEVYPCAKSVLQEADEALGFGLSAIIAAGPEETLRLTYYTQPAILTASIACLRAFSESSDRMPTLVAGHSLGEYTALVAAGSLAFADAVRLVYLRGQLMDTAVPAGRGTMAAVLGADLQLLSALCATISNEAGVPVELANVNCPGQVVVSGAVTAVEQLIARVGEAKARRAIRLDVSGPFHSSMMEQAGVALAAKLTDTTLAKPMCPVVANVTAKAQWEPDDMVQALARQVASPVLWEATVHTFEENAIDTVIEFGPGTVLSGLIKKTTKAMRTLHVEDPESLLQTLSALETGEVKA